MKTENKVNPWKSEMSENSYYQNTRKCNKTFFIQLRNTRCKLMNANNAKRYPFSQSKHKNKQVKEILIPTSLTAISREPWHTGTRVVVYTVYTRSTVLTRVIDTLVDVF